MQIQGKTFIPNDQEALGLVQHCSKQELQEFLEDEGKLLDVIQDLPQVKQICSEKEMMNIKNKSMAEYNLSIEPKLVAMRSQVANLYEEANKLKTELAKDKSIWDSKRNEVSLDVTNVMLQTEAAKSEEESEKIADNFCEGKLDVDTFLESYISSRTYAHLRQTKSQKLNELVREHASAASNSSHGQSSFPWNSDMKTGGPTPYPSYSSGQAFSMPQPNFYAR